MNKLGILFILVLICCLLTGCWSSTELTDSALLIGAALEKKGNQYHISYQMMDPKKVKSNASAAFVMISSSGPTHYEASNSLMKGLKRVLFLSHTKAVVVSADLARREGVLNIIDLGLRNNEFRLNSYLYIAEDPVKVLGLVSPLDPMPAIALFKGAEIIRKRSSQLAVITFREFFEMALNPLQCAYVGLLREHKEEKPNMTHTDIRSMAILKKGKMVKELDDPHKIRGVELFNNKITLATASVPLPEDPKEMAAIHILKSDTKIKPIFEDGKLAFQVKVKFAGDINEWLSERKLTENIVKQLEKAVEEEKKKEMNEVLAEMRKEPVTDILNLGLELYRQYPKEWHKIKDHWDDMFKKVEVRIDVEGTIKNMGMIRDRKSEEPHSYQFPWSH